MLPVGTLSALPDLGPVYTWCTLTTGVKLNNNQTQYSSPEIF